MNFGVVMQATGLFAVTNIDGLFFLSIFFAQSGKFRGATTRIVLGQYLGFTAILTVAIATSLGAAFLPESAIPYLGLLPLVFGIKAAWQAWSEAHGRVGKERKTNRGRLSALEVAAVTFANGGDNIGIYVPNFVAAGPGGISVYVTVFLVLIPFWCVAGRFFATHPVIARVFSRWGSSLLPTVLIVIGILILVRGGAFGL